MRIRIIASLLALAFAGSAAATPISFTFTGSGSGSLGGTAFGETAFIITALADTDARVGPQAGSVYYIDHTSATIELAGIGSFSFLTQTRTFVNNDVGSVGFSRGSLADSWDLYNGSFDPVFETWDMLTGIGAITSSYQLIQWGGEDFAPVITSAGTLEFANSDEFFGTFTAAVTPASVPEPSTFGLLSAGLIGVWLSRRRLRKHAEA